jgi:hypothetical protein
MAATSTGQHKRREYVERHPCLEWNSKPLFSVWAGKHISCLRPGGHCDRRNTLWGMYIYIYIHVYVYIPLRGRRDPQCSETSRLPHFPANSSHMAVRIRALFSGRFLLCQRLNRPQNHRVAGRIRSIEKSGDLIGNRNRDLPTCSIVPQLTMLPRSSAVYRTS